ncbi:MAG: anthranilate phosphoribosyltransferase [Candidatus Margulisbacteria bacterium]|nr:anthranilate phosphoribosyltransferase [Candidatus Margulisiibacteriota bacterium]
MMDSCLKKLTQKLSLTSEESEACLQEIFAGQVKKETIKDFLTLLHNKGESVSEIVGFATAMRRAMSPIELSDNAIDICGTGGYTQDRFNISTAAAFVIASFGIPVAKHGNRGSRKSNGSFDFLEALGIQWDKNIQARFSTTHLAFLFARNHHPAMRFVAEARNELPFRTTFNLLGPLCNPASVKRQVIGTSTQENAEKLIEALQKLGTERAMVIVGSNGLDELSTEAPSLLYELVNGAVIRGVFKPKELFRSSMPLDPIGSAQQNADLCQRLFSEGITDHPISKAIALNAAVGVYIAGKSESIEKAYPTALAAIETKRAWDILEKFKSI